MKLFSLYSLFLFLSLLCSSWAATEGGWSPQLAQPKELKVVHKTDLNLGTSPFSPGSHNLAIDLGQIFLMGELNNRYSDSLGVRAHYTYGVSELFSFDGLLGYSEHSDGNFTMSYLATGLRTNFSWYDKIIPYGIFGLGFYRPSHRDLTLHTPQRGTLENISSVLFGLHMGPGLDLELNSRVFFGVALTFHKVFNVDKQFADGSFISLGGAITSFLIRGGVTF